MNKTSERDSSSNRKPTGKSRAALRNGLLEMAPRRRRQLYWGTLSLENDRLLLQQARGKVVPILCFTGENAHELDRQVVSVVGHESDGDSADQPIVAEKVVSHEAVALRAYELYQSGAGGTAAENWLRAERELLAY